MAACLRPKQSSNERKVGVAEIVEKIIYINIYNNYLSDFIVCSHFKLADEFDRHRWDPMFMFVVQSRL